MEEKELGHWMSNAPAGPTDTLLCVLAHAEKNTALLNSTKTNAILFPSYEAFVNSGQNAALFLVHGAESDWVTQTVIQLRQDKVHGDKPLFISASCTPLVECLIDGVVSSDAQARASAHSFNALRAELPSRVAVVTQDHRLLQFLYERPDFIISPYKDWQTPRVYGYPLLACMQTQAGDESRWIHTLLARQLIEPVTLVDRLRECPKCQSAHLAFVDVCPTCHSLNIAQKPFVHCFTCGNMAPQEKYMDKGGLVCPKCSARLRHIGEDYDRPMENYSCNACNAGFIDADVRVRCMSCNSEHAVDDLAVRQINSYRLSEHGRVVARTGGSDDLFSVLDRINHVTPAMFEHMLDWVLNLCERHPDVPFSVLGIKVMNLTKLIEEIGRARVMQLLDAFIGRLRELIRLTDFVTHTADDQLWVLLPKADEPGVARFIERLNQLQELAQNEGQAGLILRTVRFSAPSQPVKGEAANQLMIKLAAKLK